MSTVSEHRLAWREHVIEVIHTCQYCAQIGLDHLSITCVSPEGAALPFTETGYRSHFINEAEVIRAGGPVAYVTSWFDEAGQSPTWRGRVEKSCQGSLF